MAGRAKKGGKGKTRLNLSNSAQIYCFGSKFMLIMSNSSGFFEYFAIFTAKAVNMFII